MTCSLPADEVHVWYSRCGAIDAARLRQRCLALLSPAERRQHDRFVFDKDRRAFLVAHALLRTTLSRYASRAPQDWTFTRSAHGKPRLAPHPAVPALCFNLSHTPQLAACAVTAGDEVGIDVESAGRDVNLAIARKYFSSSERAHLARAAPAEQKGLFLQYWTLKEAYVKARGVGLSLPLSQFAFSLRAGRPPAVCFAAELEDDAERWQFFQRRLASGYWLAVAVQRRASPRSRLIVREAACLVDLS